MCVCVYTHTYMCLAQSKVMAALIILVALMIYHRYLVGF